MKKIVYYSYNEIRIYDSTDYIKIEKDNQNIDDKYVDYLGNKYNEYNSLDEGDLIIRCLYYISFHYDSFTTRFKKLKYYYRYPIEIDEEIGKRIDKIKENLNTYNSVFNFDVIKNRIIRIFSIKIEINAD